MTIHTANYTVEWKPSASWVDITAWVLSVEGDFQTTGASGNGIAFGDSSTAQFSVTLDPLRSGTLSLATWELVPIRVTFTVDAATARNGAGVVVGFDQDMDTATLKAEGYQKLIAATRVYSALFLRRPAATKTSASSIEDPTDGSYAAGAINYALWQAGGRPYEQAGSYSSAAFYYSLQQALIAPDYSWLAGENAWEACLTLCRAAGGQLYQRPDGVIAYVAPLSIAAGSSVFTLTSSDYARVTRSGTVGSLMASVECPYQGRYLTSVQEIISDTTARVVAAGKTATIELEPRYPIYQLETLNGGGTQLVADAITATNYDGSVATFTHTLTIAAQRVTIVVSNTSAQPFVIEKITIRARAVAPGEAGVVSAGSGAPTLTIEANDFIQSRAHAQRLTRMALDFFAQARPIIKVEGLLHNPALQIGDIGALTVTPWGMTSTSVVILGLGHSQTGAEMALDVIDITGLPTIADYWIVSASGQSGTKKVGY